MQRLQANGIAQLNGMQRTAHSALSYGLDVVVHAETGAGKTLSFALPLLSALSDGWREAEEPAVLQAVVVVPTLELAAQIGRVLNTLEPGAAAALQEDSTSLPACPVVVGPPAMLLAFLSEPVEAVAAPAGGKRGRRPDKPTQDEWYDDWYESAAPTVRLRPEAVAAVRVAVLDEADALLMPLSKYATAQQKMSRAAHPKEAATLLQLLCAARGPALQLVAASATVGRPLRRQLSSLSGRPSFEVIRPSETAEAAAPRAADAQRDLSADSDNRQPEKGDRCLGERDPACDHGTNQVGEQ